MGCKVTYLCEYLDFTNKFVIRLRPDADNDTLTYGMQEIKLSIYGSYRIRWIIFDICYIRR